MSKMLKVLLIILPVAVMIACIPAIENDGLLAFLYAIITAWALQLMKATRKDYLVFFFGMVAMFFSEWVFISTGVENFARNSLFGLMPVWLPILWGYGFVAIKRAVVYL